MAHVICLRDKHFLYGFPVKPLLHLQMLSFPYTQCALVPQLGSQAGGETAVIRNIKIFTNK